MTSIVVLTDGCEYAERILEGLSLRRIVPEAVLIVGAKTAVRQESQMQRARRILNERTPRQMAAGLIRQADRMIGSSVHRAEESDWPARWAGLARTIERVGPLDGRLLLDRLDTLKPDFMVLARVGIVTESALKRVRKGTFNVHPSLLPWIRGLGGTRSLDARVPFGVTAHLVDAGIDTGAVIRRCMTPVTRNDTLISVKRKNYALAAKIMVDVVADACDKGVPDAVIQGRRFPYRKVIAPEEVGAYEQAMADGLAFHLYEDWHAFFDGDELPAEDVPSPPVALDPVR